jgi:excisionase family DNA binding protein
MTTFKKGIRLLSYNEVAEIFGVSRRMIERAVHEGKLQPIRIGPRTIRFHPDHIQAWIDSLNDE